jgi:sulfate transport system permease protein
MSELPAAIIPPGAAPSKRPIPNTRIGDRPLVKWTIIGLTASTASVLLLLPLAIIFSAAFAGGVELYASKVIEPDTLHAVWLTVLTALVAVPVNTVFGIAAAWAITRFQFPGRRFLIVLIELPFSISPIVAGVAYLFVFGTQGLFGPWLEEHGIRIMFAVPGIFLVSMFVTCPYVARELITVMSSRDETDELAAVSLGASGFQTFFRVTLPNMKLALLYGVLLCNARVMGEFGAVSIVSGSIRGRTNTLPLQIELLFNDYNTLAAFAAATLLTTLALVTLVLKLIIERRR